MSDKPKKSHSAIRTFAQDLAEARNSRGQSTDQATPAATEPTKVTTSEPKAVPHQPAQGPAKTTHAETKAPTISHTPAPKPMSQPKVPTTPTTHSPAAPSLQEKMDAVTSKKPTPAKKAVTKKTSAPKISVKTNSKPSRANIGFDATIITDNKDERFNPFTAAAQSFKKWLKAFSLTRKKKSPVYTVPDTQRRKGVIQKATSKSGSIFTADSAELKAKIKRRQKQAEALKQVHDEEGEISWSPFTDTGFALLESPEETERVNNPHNVSVEFKKHSRPESLLVTEKNSIPPVPPAPVALTKTETETTKEIKIQKEDEQDDSRWTAPAKPETTPAPVVEAPSQEPTPTSLPEVKEVVEVEKTPEPVTPPVKIQTPQKEAPIKPKFPKKNFFQTFNTNALAMGIVAGLSGVVVLFFTAMALIGYLTSIDPVVTYDTTSYLETATANPVAVPQVNSITDIPLQAGTLLGADYVDTQLFYESGEVVPPAVIISALQFRMLPSFVQSLTDIRFAQESQSKPIIVLEFADTDTALGGLLAWEDNMAKDLKEIYLITQSNDVSFIDDTIAGKDIRILQSADGKILAVYGITSDHTAIITSSLETYTYVMQTSFKD